jgi:hypothetical protein
LEEAVQLPLSGAAGLGSGSTRRDILSIPSPIKRFFGSQRFFRHLFEEKADFPEF